MKTRIYIEDEPARGHKNLKHRVAHYIQLGTGHPAVRMRYGTIIAKALKGCSLDMAIRRVNHWYREEREACQIVMALGGLPPQHRLNVLAETRVMLRLLRRSPLLSAYFAGILAFVPGTAIWDRVQQ